MNARHNPGLLDPDDLVRSFARYEGWVFEPPLPHRWLRRARTFAGTHPAGSRLDLSVDWAGRIAATTRWSGADGAVIDFAAVVPWSRESLLLALLSRPGADATTAANVAADAIDSFWGLPSERPDTLRLITQVVQDAGEHGQDPDAMRDSLENLYRHMDRRQRQRQDRARRQGWEPRRQD
ncbi:hypothetical protein [Dietzia sp. 179-F 9C3 NHS]|uniref:hypothetical protein n=1 Tax=Dietzia sp. 179-F 9C3 NHS TaxID=3374295 RepID=UPI003879C444